MRKSRAKASVVKDKGLDFVELGGDVVGCVERSSACVSQPCLELELFSEEPTLLTVLPLAWVLQTLKEICHVMGISCEGFEEELLALFAAIEASNSKQASASCSSLGKRGSRELKSLVCSINYDANSGSASCGRVKGRAASGFL